MGESPSEQPFAENALSGRGRKHIGVQILGDRKGDLVHFVDMRMQREIVARSSLT